jgi:hypothetical protein
MDYRFELRIPGDPAYVPLAIRMVKELEGLPEGPGAEISRLLPALEPLFAASLETLALHSPSTDLCLRFDVDEVHVQIDLQLLPAAGGDEPPMPLGDREAEILEALERTIDEVDRAAPDEPFRLTLRRHIPC